MRCFRYLLLASTIAFTPMIAGGQIVPPSGMSADTIMLHAINSMSARAEGLRTLRGRCHSRMVMQIKGPPAIQRHGEEIAISDIISTHASDVTRNYGVESISRIRESEGCGRHAEVLHRRITPGAEPPAELLALGGEIDLGDERVRILNAEIASPLGPLGGSHYRYTLRGTERVDGEDIHLIDVRPARRGYPGFEGTVKIAAGTFQPVEADLKLCEGTAIAFLRDLRLTQRFQEIGAGLHYPAYQQITAEMEFIVMPKVAASKGTLSSTIVLTELEANAPHTDFPCGDGITVAPLADSTAPAFWELHTHLAAAPTYPHLPSDSMMTRNDSLARMLARNPLIDGSIIPSIEFNRVAGEMPGIIYKGRIGRARLATFAAYSFSMERFMGEASVAVPLTPGEAPWLELTAEAYSILATTGSDRSYPRLLNALSTWILHSDYYDYFMSDGWSAGVRATSGKLRGSLVFGLSQQQSRRKTTSRFYFGKEPYRPNPAILDGDFRTVRGELRWGTPDYMSDFLPTRPLGLLRLPLPQPSRFDARLSALHGGRTGGEIFNALEGTLLFSLPTVTTGYLPMTLRIGLEGGIGSRELPPQYQFRMRSSTGIQGMFGEFFSAPVGLYGGTSYITLHLDHNFSDLLWRTLDLPVYEGRGPDITLAGSVSSFAQKNESGYQPTRGGWYGEIGLGVGRIPLIVSNTLYLRLDARWGIGPLGTGRVGGGIGVTGPF